MSAATAWAKAEATRKALPLDSISLRSILGPAFKQIRFLTYSLSEFVNGPMKSKLLSNEEKIAIMSCIESESTSSLQDFHISKIKRKQIDIQKEGISCRCTVDHTCNVRDNIDSILGFSFSSNVRIYAFQINVPYLSQVLSTRANASNIGLTRVGIGRSNAHPGLFGGPTSRQSMSYLIVDLKSEYIKFYIQKSYIEIESVKIKNVYTNNNNNDSIIIIMEKSIQLQANNQYKINLSIQAIDIFSNIPPREVSVPVILSPETTENWQQVNNNGLISTLFYQRCL